MVDRFMIPAHGVIVLNEDGNKITLSAGQTPDNLKELNNKIRLYFGVHQYSLYYIDEDGDKFLLP